jgi:hypothetical protein
MLEMLQGVHCPFMHNWPIPFEFNAIFGSRERISLADRPRCGTGPGGLGLTRQGQWTSPESKRTCGHPGALGFAGFSLERQNFVH